MQGLQGLQGVELWARSFCDISGVSSHRLSLKADALPELICLDQLDFCGERLRWTNTPTQAIHLT